MKNLVVAFRNFSNAPKFDCVYNADGVLLYATRTESLNTSSLFSIDVHKSAQLYNKMYNKMQYTYVHRWLLIEY
jgi:hypothetical protein